jgi:hypothetical protein
LIIDLIQQLVHFFSPLYINFTLDQKKNILDIILDGKNFFIYRLLWEDRIIERFHPSLDEYFYKKTLNTGIIDIKLIRQYIPKRRYDKLSKYLKKYNWESRRGLPIICMGINCYDYEKSNLGPANVRMIVFGYPRFNKHIASFLGGK